LFAILAADGIRRAARDRAGAESIAGAALVGTFFFWTLPALSSVRNEISPPVAAVQSIRQHLDPKRDQLYVALPMVPFVEYFAPYYPFLRVLDERALPVGTSWRRPWQLTELDMTPDRGYSFHRERGHLWNIARRHYFDVALAPVRVFPQFVSGWYGAERSGSDEWRWMGARSVTRLPPAQGDTVLRLVFDVPDELMPLRPLITVKLNGAIVGRFRPKVAHLSRDYRVQPAPGGAPNVLELETERALNPARQHVGEDARDLGLLVRMLSWGPGKA
jgi:hypothetical protein